MNLKAKLNYFWLQKLGNEQEDYEDAFASKNKDIINNISITLAVADGATESLFASIWAKMLTKSFVEKPFFIRRTLQRRTNDLSNEWQRYIQSLGPLPWYAEEKTHLGAFATILGVRFKSKRNSQHSGSWSAIALGDTCLFQIRNNELICSFPISSADKFGRFPHLLSSNLSYNLVVWDKVRFKKSEWRTGDLFILATDALAYWFLSQNEQNKKPWNDILNLTRNLSPSESFKSWVNDLRKSSQLKNDDVTILLLRL